MGYYYKRKFYTRVDKHGNDSWSFGIGLAHFEEETYLYIHFYRLCFSIGYLYECEIRR